MNLLKTSGSSGAGERLFLNEDLSDVCIIVKGIGPSWRFPAHTLLLSAQSIVFRCMLENDFSERENREIIIEDISPTTVGRLLQYMYCGKADLDNWKEAIDLLKAAHKYQVEPLVQKCAKYLENGISLTNVCYIFHEAAVYSLITLKEKCLGLILDAGFIVLRSKAFEILCKESVMEVVSDARLNVDSELTVFDSLLRWALMHCCQNGKEVIESNILLELQPFLQHVCFDDMSDTDKGALPTSILSYMKPNNRTRLHFSVIETLLPHASRLNFVIDQLNVVALGAFAGNCIRFSVDSSVYLIGFTFVMLAVDPPTRFMISLQEETAGSTVIFNINAAQAVWLEGFRISSRNQYTAEILLRQPAHLEEKSVYKLYCAYPGNETQCFNAQMARDNVSTASGPVHVTLHCDNIWGVTGLLFL